LSKTRSKGKTYVKTAILGLISLASYYFLLTNQELVTKYFIKGGYYAALPIVAALYFSLVHGAFASNVISLMGITPKKTSH
jgi:hypothetical protein